MGPYSTGTYVNVTTQVSACSLANYFVDVLQNVVRRNATKLVLSMEENKPTIQGWLIKVKNGHAKRCWCVLIGKMFLSFRTHAETVCSSVKLILLV